MNKIKTLFIFLSFISVAQADLLSRLSVEEVLKERIQQAIKIKDNSAKITVRIEFNKYESNGESLPGTNFNQESFYADKLDVADIKKVNVQFFSTQSEITDEQRTLIHALVPIDKNKISILFITIPTNEMVPTGIQPSDLSEIANQTVKFLSIALSLIFGLVLIVIGAIAFLNGRKNRDMIKQQIGTLASAISENGMGQPSVPQSFETQSKANAIETQENSSDQSVFADYSFESLSALFSDLYWCEKDGEAHYLWNKITIAQKTNLLEQLDFMYGYTMHFLNSSPIANEDLLHPYYNKPLAMNKTSQEALSSLVKKNFALWSKISPLRQQTLQLSLKEKIKANSTPAGVVKVEEFPVSKLRSLPRPVAFGEISFEDEMEIYKDHQLVPKALQSSVPSLVWLALKDKAYVEQQFEQLDAKFMATGWVAAPEILRTLEKCIPEKKLLLLQSYLKSLTPSKAAPAFEFMFRLGLKESHQNDELLSKAS